MLTRNEEQGVRAGHSFENAVDRKEVDDGDEGVHVEESMARAQQGERPFPERMTGCSARLA